MKSKALKSVLITGGSDGLGRAAAVLLAERNYQVFAAGRNVEKLATLEEFAKKRNLPLETVQLDVCDDTSVEAGIREVERRAGVPDVLINNAGIAIVAAMEEISLDDLKKQFETNVFGAARVTRRIVPGMRERRSGRIINMSSILGKLVHPLWGPYCASKHALEAISDALRLELYPFGVEVVVIEPGYIGTNIKQSTGEHSVAYAARAEQSPYAAIYKRLLHGWLEASNHTRDTPEDCARVILQAMEETPPRARYAVTRMAKFWTVARRFYSDRAFDRRCRRNFGLDALRKANEPSARSN